MKNQREEEGSLAMLILQDLKNTNKKLIIANIIEGLAIVLLIIGQIIK